MSDQKAVQAKPTEAAIPAAKASAPAKKKRKESPVYKFYQVKGGKVERLRKECPRCGRGVFLAEHRDRLTCGKCGYTSFKKK
ncbi:MAG TPA: 30S ribosomal protein S27ae [Nitrososphaerales archaeon]|nr:30S ribosomal protein S27ae [Nitrososphaerales archaeon]